jgi:hypothetical protein
MLMRDLVKRAGSRIAPPDRFTPPLLAKGGELHWQKQRGELQSSVGSDTWQRVASSDVTVTP